MGKIRVKTFGSPEQEEEEKKKTKEKREARLQRAESARQSPNGSSQMADEHRDGGQAKKSVKAPGLKGGERVVAVGPSEEELEKEVTTEQKDETRKAGKKEKFAKKTKSRSKRYQESAQALDRSKVYSITEALELLAKFQKTRFDETVELHLNTTKTGISGNLTLPHGTGKKTRVIIADDKLIAEIETGKVDFDILLAKPDMMPKLARVARILGPKGLMPNPKNGTITQNPQDLIKKYEAGQVSFKTEVKAPLMHLTVGKFSFGDKKLKENINAIVVAVKPENIQKVVLKSTMSPAIKVKI